MWMRSHPAVLHWSFLLPRGIDPGPPLEGVLAAPGCRLFVIPPLVKINGFSREAVFEAATNHLRELKRQPGPHSIAATLKSPPPVAGTDSWHIIVGADIAFSPTSLNPHFPQGAGA